MTALMQLLTVLSPPAALLLKVTLLLAVSWAAHFALARANPRWRVLAWRMVMVGLIALPAAQWAMPKLRVPVAEPVRPAALGVATTEPVITPSLATATEPAVPVPQAQPALSSPPPFSVGAWAKANVALAFWLLWGLVAVILSARHAHVFRRLRRLLRATAPAPDSRVSQSPSPTFIWQPMVVT